jgi:inosine-uridine nucleoside N-ribohydrolase
MRSEPNRKAIILDTDPGIGAPGSAVDDGLAIVLGLLRPTGNLLGSPLMY